MSRQVTDKASQSVGGFFLAFDNSEPPQLWVWRGDKDESAEPWVFVASYRDTNQITQHGVER